MRVGTVFAHSHLPLTTWFNVMFHMTMEDGISALALQKKCRRSHRTAVAMLEKIRGLMVPTNEDSLNGTVSIDLADVKTADGRVLILVACQCDGLDVHRIQLRVLEHGSLVNAILDSVAGRKAKLVTENAEAYDRVKARLDICLTINPSKVSGHPICANLANAFQVWLDHKYSKAVSCKKLQDYLNEYAFRYNHCRYSPALDIPMPPRTKDDQELRKLPLRAPKREAQAMTRRAEARELQALLARSPSRGFQELLRRAVPPYPYVICV
jgi:hypothetical protein